MASPKPIPMTMAPAATMLAKRQDPSTTSAPPPITTAPNLTCTDGSTVTFTNECTLGFPISYCTKPQPLTSCPPSSFPGTYHPGHCETAQTCYPVDAYWLTPSCSNGAIPSSTETLFTGTLSGATAATTITNVHCNCASDAYFTWYQTAPNTATDSLEDFCLPLGNCPPGMTGSVFTNSYCQTATDNPYCSGRPTETTSCNCLPESTAVYPLSGNTATATGCVKATVTTA